MFCKYKIVTKNKTLAASNVSVQEFRKLWKTVEPEIVSAEITYSNGDNWQFTRTVDNTQTHRNKNWRTITQGSWTLTD